MAKPEVRLAESIEALKIAKVASCTVVPEVSQIRMLCRIEHPDKRKNANAARAWLAVIDAILMEEERLIEELEDEYEAAMEDYEALPKDDEGEIEKPPEKGVPPWNVHICKHYMRRNSKLVFGWNLTLQANASLRTAVSDICRLLAIMSRHVDTFLQQPVALPPQNQTMVMTQPVQQSYAGPNPNSAVLGQGRAGKLDGMGQVIEMPLIGVSANRNAPQAPMLTPGVGGRGRKSGVSSRGAHLVRG